VAENQKLSEQLADFLSTVDQALLFDEAKLRANRNPSVDEEQEGAAWPPGPPSVRRARGRAMRRHSAF
jgi:hypothetical protein